MDEDTQIGSDCVMIGEVSDDNDKDEPAMETAGVHTVIGVETHGDD
jgi:hypothetical protein